MFSSAVFGPRADETITLVLEGRACPGLSQCVASFFFGGKECKIAHSATKAGVRCKQTVGHQDPECLFQSVSHQMERIAKSM
jgi:hypothetical protein